jgi:hypothetical protein
LGWLQFPKYRELAAVVNQAGQLVVVVVVIFVDDVYLL